MRIDAKNLLNRLGKNDFSYKEFEDRFNELELWPIFEALLHDPRLQAIDRADRLAPVAEEEPEIVEANDPQPLSALFNRYAQGPQTEPEQPEAHHVVQTQDIRAMLRHLSDIGGKGKI